MSASAPLAVPAFIATCEAALPSSFDVRFGQIFGPYVPPQSLLITGVHFNEDEYAELGLRYQHEEHYNIQCELLSSAGTSADNSDQTDRFLEVYALYQDIQVAVAANPKLSDTVRLGWCRQLDYTPTGDAKGFSVGQLTFEVEVQARVNSLS